MIYMNREQLKELGLSEEQINTVMAAHGTAINTAKDDLKAVRAERDDLVATIGERDAQLAELGDKVKGDADLTAEIDRLKSENETTTAEYQKKLAGQALDFATHKVMTDYKVRNPKAVKALLNAETLALEGEEVLTLKEQLDALKESDAYLFDSEEDDQQSKKPRSVPSGNPNGGNNLPPELTEHERRMKKWKK